MRNPPFYCVAYGKFALMELKGKDGSLIFSTDNGTRKFTLMGDDYITLNTNTDTPFYPPIGSYCECSFGRFELTGEGKAAPAIGVGYNYSVRLDNQYVKWNNKLFMWHRGQADATTNFSVAVNLTGAMDLILADLKALGFKYRFGGTERGYSYNVFAAERKLSDGYTIEGIDGASEVKTLQFDGMGLLDALYYIAKQWGTECWVEESIINIGKCENTAKVKMSYTEGGNIAKISRSDSSNAHATRLYVYGGTANVPARYRKRLIFTTQDGTTVPNDPFGPGLFPESMRVPKPGQSTGKVSFQNVQGTAHTYAIGSSVDISEPLMFPLGTSIKATRGNYKVDLSGFGVFLDQPFAVAFRSTSLTFELEYAEGKTVSIPADGWAFGEDTVVFDSDMDISAARRATVRFRGTNSYFRDNLGYKPTWTTFQVSLSAGGTVDFKVSGEAVPTKIHIITAPGKPELDGTGMACTFNPGYAADGTDDARKMSVTLPPGTSFTIDGIVEKDCPTDWFYSQESGNVNRENRLQLDAPLTTGDGDEESYIDAQVIHDDIYPRMKGHYVTSIEVGTASAKDEDGKEYKVKTYKVKDDKLIGFKESYILQGEELKMYFTGELHDGHVPLLAGLEIPVRYSNSTGSFELIRTKVGETYFPNDNHYPQVGDGYTLTGYDADYMEGELVKEAEAELKERGLKDLADYKVDNSTYSVTLFSYEGNFYQAGTRVDLVAKGLFKDEDFNTRKSRVIGYELDLAVPYKAPTYTVGEAEAYSRLQAMDDKIDSVGKGSYVGAGGGGNSVYVIGRGDTTAPSDTNVYSAARGDNEYIFKDRPDTALAPVEWEAGQHFNKGLTSGETIDSMVAGKGTLVTDDGRIQTDRLEVRQSMTVMDLIVNQIQGMASDFEFSDVAKVAAVEVTGADTYRLTLEKKTDFDVMLFREDDIIRQVVNTLPKGGAEYYTSWMRIVSTNSNENSVQAVTYPDSEVPGGKNYAPAAGYNIGRRGNAIQEVGNARAGEWYLSSLEGRIAFLMNVFKPVLEKYNYGTIIGNIPEGVVPGIFTEDERRMAIYAKNLFVDKAGFHQIDYNGNIVTNAVFRGEWSLDVAKSSAPYRNITREYEATGSNKAYTLLEQHTVSHFGCIWGCLVDKTQEEPKWNARGWVMLEGDPNYTMEIESTAGKLVLLNSPDTTLIAHVYHSNREITDEVMATAGVSVEWSRDTGNVPEDNAWSPTYHAGGGKNEVELKYADMGSGWGGAYRKVTFTCRAVIPVGGGKSETAERSINFRN